MRPQWIIGIMAASLAFLLMGSVVGVAAIQRRTITAPYVNWSVGSISLQGFITDTPHCREAGGRTVPNQRCMNGSLYSPMEYYAVWLVVRESKYRIRENRLLLIRLDESPPVGTFNNWTGQ